MNFFVLKLLASVIVLNVSGNPEEINVRLQNNLQKIQLIANNIATPKEKKDTPKPAAFSGTKVQIEVFSDFQCPYCARFSRTIEALLEREDLEIVFRHYPLGYHSFARGAASAALCAGEQGKFWAMHKAIFAHNDNLGLDNLKILAKDLGLDLSAFGECVEASATNEKIEADIARGREKGVNKTPTTFVNGEKVEGNVPLENLEKIIRKQQK